MHDMPSMLLLQQEHSRPKTGEELEVLGKAAAQKYIGGACATLNEAVVGTIKHAGLSPEQVRRVIEFANTDAYLTEFNKEGEYHKYVEFHGGPASPSEVLSDLNDGGGGTVFDRGLADYSRLPDQAKTAALMETNLDVVHDALTAMCLLEKVALRVGVDPSLYDIAGDMQGDVMKSYSLPSYGGSFDPFGEQQKQLQVRMLSAMTGHKPVVVKHANFSPMAAEMQGLAGAEPPSEQLPPEQEEQSVAPPMGPATASPMGYDPLQDHMKVMQQHMKLMQQTVGQAPEVPKVASLDFNPAETMLRNAFYVGEEQHYPYANPMQDSLELHDKLAGAAEHVTSEVIGLENELLYRADELFHEVKQAALAGVSLGQMLSAWQFVVPGSEYVKTAFAYLGPRLVEEEVFGSTDQLGASLEKTAHRGVVNPDHPLVASMGAYCVVLDKLAELRVAQDALIEQREAMGGFLQKVSFLAERGGAVKLVTEGARQAGKAVRGGAKTVGEELLGQGSSVAHTGSNLLGSLVDYAPHLAVAGGTVAAANAMKDTPVGEAALSMVPGTRANAMREQARMMRRGY